MKFSYPVNLIQQNDGSYLVKFPDIPEALTDGETKKEASFEAYDCLIAAIGGYINERRDIPKPSLSKPGQEIINLPPLVSAKIALYQESDPAARAELLKTISNVDNFLLSTGEFVKQIQEEGSAWSEMKVTDINTTFGINGSDDESIKNNQGFLGFISGQSDADYNLAYDPKTNSITLDAKGKVGESQWSVTGFNSVDYLGSGGELLYPIPQLKEEIINSSTKLITDDKGKLLPGISKDMEFKRISANVKDDTGKIIGKKLV